MKILAAVADYPNNNGKVTLMYVHTRNIYYKKSGIDVTVLNFSAKEDYEIDGIKVISINSYLKGKRTYDILICHAANIRNHYRFLKRFGKNFKKYIFFYHGHEILKCNKIYPKPYKYQKNSLIKKIIQDIYDSFKLFIWNKYLPKIKNKAYFIFVSNWMKEEFIKWTKIDKDMLKKRSFIIYNSVGELFEKNRFDDKCKKEYDFITIRNNLDDSKYSIDIVNELAKNTPDKRFVVVGKGDYFNHCVKAPNLKWINSTMNHEQIIEILQKSFFALMPTRADAQGLMMCEMAAFGIPVITSDIPICYEIFKDFGNVYYIDNNETKKSLNSFSINKCKSIKHSDFFADKTILKEISIIKNNTKE